jgi:hypothetical protein
MVQSNRTATIRYSGLDGIIMGISFPFSRTCLPLLGFPFGRNRPLLTSTAQRSFPPHHPPSYTKLRFVTIPAAGSICSYSHVILQGTPQIFPDNSFPSIFIPSLYSDIATSRPAGEGLLACRQAASFRTS